MAEVSKKCIAVAVLALAGSTMAHAAQWNIVSVETGKEDGFTFSLLHTSHGKSPMRGNTIGSINGVSNGAFDDETGDFTATFAVKLDGSTSDVNYDTTGNLDFTSNPADKWLDSTSHLNVTGESLSFNFAPGEQCCSDRFAPNSFVVLEGGSAVLSLWGSTREYNDKGEWAGPSGNDYGVDLRLKLEKVPGSGEVSTVPVPAAVWLFGSALFGLLGWRRRAIT